MQAIEPEFMVFIGEGMHGVGSVREVHPGQIVLYVENAGDFVVPLSAVAAVHDGKVILSLEALSPDLVAAIRHMHDREDPDFPG